LRDYFKEAIFVDNGPKDICNAIREIIRNVDLYEDRMSSMRERLVSEWEERFIKLENQLAALPN
jgi:hypothetical protein